MIASLLVGLILSCVFFAGKHFGNRLLHVLERTKYDFSYVALYSRFFHYNPDQRLDDLMPQEGWYLECGAVALLYRSDTVVCLRNTTCNDSSCRRETLPGFIDFVRRDIFKDPLDWAVFTYYDNQGKRPAIFQPSLFQHVGDISTFRVCVISFSSLHLLHVNDRRTTDNDRKHAHLWRTSRLWPLFRHMIPMVTSVVRITRCQVPFCRVDG